MQEPSLMQKAIPNTFSTTKKGAGVVLSNNNRKATISPLGDCVFGQRSRTSGQHYFEMVATQFEGSISFSPLIGIASIGTTFNSPWVSSGELFWYSTAANNASQLIYANDSRVTYSSQFTQGDHIGVALNFTTRILEFYRNGVPQGQINLNVYVPGVTEFWPCASSPHGAVGQTVVDFPLVPLYLPAGFTPW